MDDDQVFEDAALVLDQALAGDGDAVAKTFSSVARREGAEGVYHVAWCLAGELAGDGLAKGAWRLDFPDIEEARYEAKWVARFISAYVNDDESTAEALVGAAIEDGELDTCLLTLAGSAVATMRRRSAKSS